jgi:hypothetical protein
MKDDRKGDKDEEEEDEETGEEDEKTGEEELSDRVARQDSAEQLSDPDDEMKGKDNDETGEDEAEQLRHKVSRQDSEGEDERTDEEDEETEDGEGTEKELHEYPKRKRRGNQIEDGDEPPLKRVRRDVELRTLPWRSAKTKRRPDSAKALHGQTKQKEKRNERHVKDSNDLEACDATDPCLPEVENKYQFSVRPIFNLLAIQYLTWPSGVSALIRSLQHTRPLSTSDGQTQHGRP